ncbi:MAG: glucokinase [Ectothiorhodospira sp.]
MEVLAGDIGGTKTLLLLARVERDTLVPIARQRYDSSAYEDLAPMVRDFLTAHEAEGIRIAAAGFALAGPVEREDGREHARLTNLPWQLDSEGLKRSLGIPRVGLLNDFEGIAHSLDDLPPEHLHPLQTVPPQPQGTQLVVGAGTGLGVCIVAPGRPVRLIPTEGGHAGFAPADERQARLWAHIARSEGRCTREHLLSGRGLGRIARFLAEVEGVRAGDELSAALASVDPAAAEITRLGLEGKDPVALETLKLFSALYGGQTGDLALACLPFGGVYIAGGIAPRLLPVLQSGAFMEAFVDKPPMSRLLERMPVQEIGYTDAGVLGAARLAAELAEGY